MLINLLNWVMVALSIVTAIMAWQIYKLTRASSLLCIFFAMMLGIIARILIALAGHVTFTTILSTGFWVLWTVGLYLLLKLLTKFMKTDVKHDADMKAEGRAQGKIEGKRESRNEELRDMKESLMKSRKP